MTSNATGPSEPAAGLTQAAEGLTDLAVTPDGSADSAAQQQQNAPQLPTASGATKSPKPPATIAAIMLPSPSGTDLPQQRCHDATSGLDLIQNHTITQPANSLSDVRGNTLISDQRPPSPISPERLGRDKLAATPTGVAPPAIANDASAPNAVAQTSGFLPKTANDRLISSNAAESVISRDRKRPASQAGQLPAKAGILSQPPAVDAARTQGRDPRISGIFNGVVLFGKIPDSTPADASPAETSSDDLGQSASKRRRSGEEWLPAPSPAASSAQTSAPEEKRTAYRPPPVSYRAPSSSQSALPTPSTPVRVAPIRSFRSSGSRKSLILDTNRKHRSSGSAGDSSNEGGCDQSPRTNDSRHSGDAGSQMTPPTSSWTGSADGDDAGDVFLKIAREESERRAMGAFDFGLDTPSSTTARTFRGSHRRPLSTAAPSYRPASPPQLSRRLSEQQQENSFGSRPEDDRNNEPSRYVNPRYSGREYASSAHTGEDGIRSRTGSILRPSPLTTRSLSHQEASSDGSGYSRRRPSVTESNAYPPRSATFKPPITGHTPNKIFHSPALNRAHELQLQQQQHQHQHQHHQQHQHHASYDGQQAVESTESNGSTTAPSTVWDELDDIRTRIHRLELTGKLPATSGGAVSRMSDERPNTATTTVTTMSSSPKRRPPVALDTLSTTSSQRESHPILVSALAKSKPYLNHEVYKALESAANDAMGLSAMTGTAGQAGPISSAASAVGSNSGAVGGVTDRQLRRKADSVCRSLLELCVALGEESNQTKTVIPPSLEHVPSPMNVAAGHGQLDLQPQSFGEVPATPNAATRNTATGGAMQRRYSNSIVTEQPQHKGADSPRAVSKFEERRHTLLTGSALPSPRSHSAHKSVPSTPNEASHARRSSLMLSRTRRPTEQDEPEENVSGRRSSLLRTRRAGTEEPDEGGRQTSHLLRSRRGTVESEDDEPRLRTPSRAVTEVNTVRGSGREHHTQAQSQLPPPPSAEVVPHGSSAIPRRRYVSNIQPPRTMVPANTVASPTRRYLDRPSDREGAGAAERAYDDRGVQRHTSLGSGSNIVVNRGSGLSTRRGNRDSALMTTYSSTAAGTYR